jgi:hypothetical protein
MKSYVDFYLEGGHTYKQSLLKIQDKPQYNATLCVISASLEPNYTPP